MYLLHDLHDFIGPSFGAPGAAPCERPLAAPTCLRDIAGMFAALLDIVAPPQCAGCGTNGATLCSACADEISRSKPIVLRGTGDLATIRAAGRYRGVLRNVILAFKYGNRKCFATPLATILARHLFTGGEIVVPVPLHRARERTRGYNQAFLLARELVDRLRTGELRVVRHALQRIRATGIQSKLTACERENNVVGAFSPGPDAVSVAGRSVLLVDDVVTTGATLRACAATLRRAGARQIDAACVAMKL